MVYSHIYSHIEAGLHDFLLFYKITIKDGFINMLLKSQYFLFPNYLIRA